MRILGFDITRWGGKPLIGDTEKALESVNSRRGWIPLILESFAGAWQQNVVVNRDLASSFHAVFACRTLIASDISKLRVKLVEKTTDGIWEETESAAFSPVLRKPNHFQTRNQFWENWVLSKLQSGNTYVLKVRDRRMIVEKLIVLDPTRVQVLVSESGDVFYQLYDDNLADLQSSVTVPATEIIHDRFNCLFHPLVGVPPIFAHGIAAMGGIKIMDSAALFFANKSQPGGILTATGAISDETAQRLKQHWEDNFSGAKAGKIAVLGDGLKYERMALTAVEAQLIEQLKWAAEVVCSTYHVPPYKVGVGAMPTNNNVQALNIEYYSQCLQSLIEAIETCLDEGLGLDAPKDGRQFGTEFDVDNLLRMDTLTQMQVLKEGTGAGILSPNEARRRIEYAPTTGGDSPLMQEQNFSLAALAKRDAKADPWASNTQPQPPDDEEVDEDEADDEADAEATQATDREAEERFAASVIRKLAETAERVFTDA